MSEQAKPVAQVSKLLRAGDAKAVSADQWQAPDLSALKAQEAEQAFQRALAQARGDVAEELRLLREVDRQTAFEEGRQLGITKGYDEGYALGLKEAQAVVDQSFEAKIAEWEAEQSAIRTEWRGLFTQVAQVFDVLDAEFFDQIVWLSAELAQRILRAELQLHPELIQRVVSDALSELPKLVYPVSVYVHPQDLTLLSELRFEHDKKVHVLPDEKLDRGECRVVSGHSELVHNWQQLSAQVMDKMLAQFVQIPLPPSVADAEVSLAQAEGSNADHEN